MRNCTKLQWMGFALVLLGACCPVTWGKTWTVGKAGAPCANPAPDYATVTAAINAASDGDEIDICPSLYPEQLMITKSLTLRGTGDQGTGRAMIQPTVLVPVGSLGFTAVITVMGTSNVTIQNLAIDASYNTVSGCTEAVAGIHFYDASGVVDSDAISGAELSNPLSCTTLFPGNGIGVQADQDSTTTATFTIGVRNSSIHDFGRNAILVNGAGQVADIENNSIVGIGPGTGANQFGIFLANGVIGQVTANYITQGNCGSIDIEDCVNLRSEGVVLRSVGDGVVVDSNIISNVQSGVFVNGATNPRVINNVVSNVDALSGIHIQGSVTGLYLGNKVFHVGPFTTDTSSDEEGCGLNSVSGTNNSANIIQGNWVNDAYCGVAYVTSDVVFSNAYMNTLYETLNGDNYPDTFPPPTEPGASPFVVSAAGVHRARKVLQ
ncbi:MAG TPA: right-handed parallel beta-helix repeat-containing protein [Bryobacteraceae bacterium]|nr:right-handed parallel beta-helix repeat-containing protein [Bryobacteraceae bacterium]